MDMKIVQHQLNRVGKWEFIGNVTFSTDNVIVSVKILFQRNGVNNEIHYLLTACVNQKFNLIFVMDGSGSIESQGKGNFQRSKDFVIDMVQSFNIGKDDTHVAVVLYSEKAQVVLKLGKYVDEVEKIVDKIEEMSYPGGKTNTGYALDEVRKEVFKDIKGSRKTVPNVVMVLTDGLSHDDVEEPAEELRDEGATIISLGVGCCYDNEELREMASDPVNEHVFAVSFSALSEIKGLVREQICHGKTS